MHALKYILARLVMKPAVVESGGFEPSTNLKPDFQNVSKSARPDIFAAKIGGFS